MIKKFFKVLHKYDKTRFLFLWLMPSQVRILFPDMAKLGNEIRDAPPAGIFAMAGSAKI